MKRKSRVESRESKEKNRELKVKRENSYPKGSRLTTHDSRLIYGVLPVLEALRAENRRIEKIIIADGANEKRLSDVLQLAQSNGVQIQKVPRENLERTVENGANHQGIIAFIAAAEYFDTNKLLNEIIAKENSLSVILDGVEDPRNLGAILRTVECSGADGVFIPERRAVGLTETVAKSSAGATEYVKVAKVVNVNRLIDELKENNIWVVGASGDAEMDYTNWDWKQSSALVLGGEGKGLHRLTAEKCDVLVKIPLLGNIESLNVSVAAGVILFEAIRQRNTSD
ncbi:23S rRNA (guanosine(2251)-2'-O)-methyltransferase RlmB [soil metagenome]